MKAPVGGENPRLEGRVHTVAAVVAELAEYLIGRDPSPIEDRWTTLYRGGFYRGGIHMSALDFIRQSPLDRSGPGLAGRK